MYVCMYVYIYIDIHTCSDVFEIYDGQLAHDQIGSMQHAILSFTAQAVFRDDHVRTKPHAGVHADGGSPQ